MDLLLRFVNDPMVSPIWAILVIGILDLLLTVYRAFQQGAFDPRKLPAILDSLVLQKVLPLTALGVAVMVVTDATAKTALAGLYWSLSATVVAAQVAAFKDKVSGSYRATTRSMDNG